MNRTGPDLRRLGVVGGLSLIACVVVAVQSPPERAVSVSRVQLAGAEFVATLASTSGWSDPPDLSVAGSTPIPRDATLRVPLPVLWGTEIVPVGEYSLSLAVEANGELRLELRSVGANTSYSLPVERADFSAPEEVRVSVSGVERGDVAIGALQIRWGALLVEGRFDPLRSAAFESGPWRLQTYTFPRATETGSTAPIGNLETAQSPRSWRLTLLDADQDRARLLLEDRAYLKLLDERVSIQRELALVRRQSTHASGDELDRLRRREATLEARARGTDERLARAASTQNSVEVPATALAQPDPAAPFAARMIARDADTLLVVTTSRRRFEFPLPKL
ncbi:MAG: hypothetical protein AB7I09_18370 [Planctomycetota bacterium]